MVTVKRTEVQIDRTGYPDIGETWTFVLNNNTGGLTVRCNSKSVSLSDDEADELFAEWQKARHEAGRR